MGGWFAKYFIAAGARASLFDDNAIVARKRAKELGCGFSKSFEETVRSESHHYRNPDKSYGAASSKACDLRKDYNRYETSIGDFFSKE